MPLENLDIDQVWALLDACIENSADLISEAQILANGHRWARAFELAYFAREELGKADDLAAAGHMLLADPNSLDWQKVSQRWADHRPKSSNAVFADLLATEIFILGHANDAEVDAGQVANEAAALRKLRMAALYVDWDNGVSRPAAAVNEDAAREAIATARRQLEVATTMAREYRALNPERARELIAEARARAYRGRGA